MKIIITLLLVFTSSVAMAHDGAVSADGCHTQGDNFHCHSTGKTDAINGTDSINGTSLRKERGKGFSLYAFVGLPFLSVAEDGLDDGIFAEDASIRPGSYFGISLEYHINDKHSVGIDSYEIKGGTDVDIVPSGGISYPFNFPELQATFRHQAVGPTYRYYFPFGLYLGLSYFSIVSKYTFDVDSVAISATEQNNKFAPSIGYKYVLNNGLTLGSRLLVINNIIKDVDSDVRSLGFTIGYDFR